MKAVGYRKPQAIGEPEALIDITLPDPIPGGGDLLVEVRAVSVNPASRPETQAWVRELGAHRVIDHGQAIAEELRRIGIPAVN